MIRNGMDKLILIADQFDWHRLGDRFRGEHAELSWSKLLMMLAVMAVFVGGMLLLKRLTGDAERPSSSCDRPPELFRDLCRVHRLDRADRRLLKRLAAAWGLASPAYLFIEPDYFDPAGLPASWHRRAARLAHLRERLFTGR